MTFFGGESSNHHAVTLISEPDFGVRFLLIFSTKALSPKLFLPSQLFLSPSAFACFNCCLLKKSDFFRLLFFPHLVISQHGGTHFGSQRAGFSPPQELCEQTRAQRLASRSFSTLSFCGQKLSAEEALRQSQADLGDLYIQMFYYYYDSSLTKAQRKWERKQVADGRGCEQNLGRVKL